jgi:nucleotide-binding universal stress UspA family protein
MSIFRKILCPVDFDPNSVAALDLARDLARQNRASIFLFHVVPMPAEGPERGVVYREREDEAEKHLERLARARLKGKVRYQISVVTGRPDRSVINAVRNTGADLVVMGTRGRKGLSRLLLGSVAERVAREARCPVLIVRPRARRRAAAPK